MDTILTLSQHDDLKIKTSHDKPLTWTRQAARCVLMDEMQRVALIYFDRDKYYKLPGGGVDEGEDIIDALKREVLEETGYVIQPESITAVGIVEEDRFYGGFHQTSYCYKATPLTKHNAQPCEGEIEAGIEVRWIDTIEKAVDLIEKSEAILNHEGDETGLKMMKIREAAILRAAKSLSN